MLFPAAGGKWVGPAYAGDIEDGIVGVSEEDFNRIKHALEQRGLPDDSIYAFVYPLECLSRGLINPLLSVEAITPESSSFLTPAKGVILNDMFFEKFRIFPGDSLYLNPLILALIRRNMERFNASLHEVVEKASDIEKWLEEYH